LAYIFPFFCLSCGSEGEILCQNCAEKQSKKIKKQGLITQDFRLQKQKSALHLSKVKALFKYGQNAILSSLLRDFKYSYIRRIEEVWKRLIGEFGWDGDYDLIIPIPLHKRRLRERGFNQSEVLSKIFYNFLKSKNPNLVLNTENLKRVKYTRQQAKLNFATRQENIKNCFVWMGGSLEGKKILLVDDVFTTGSTLEEAAKALKAQGALNVEAFVLGKD